MSTSSSSDLLSMSFITKATMMSMPLLSGEARHFWRGPRNITGKERGALSNYSNFLANVVTVLCYTHTHTHTHTHTYVCTHTRAHAHTQTRPYLIVSTWALAILCQCLQTLHNKGGVPVINVEFHQTQPTIGACKNTVQKLQSLQHQVTLALAFLMPQQVLHG